MTFGPADRSSSLRIQSTGEPWLGWGIVGASTAAARHFVPALRALAEPRDSSTPVRSRAVAIYSSNIRRAQNFADRQQIPHAYDDLHALLARTDIQCIYIANQIHRHSDAVVAALDAGKHILCEPPISTDPSQVEMLTARAGIRTRQLWVNHFWRYDSAIRAMRETLHDGMLGELLSLAISNAVALAPQAQTWRLQPGAGVLWDRTLQDVDLLLFLLGETPELVWATSGQRILGQHEEVDEEIAAILRWPRGMLVRIHDAFFDPHTPANVALHGTYAVLQADKWSTLQAPTELHQRRRGETSHVEVTDVPPMQSLVAHFMQSVRTDSTHGSSVASTGDDHLSVVRVVAALHDACRRGHTVRIHRSYSPLG